MPGTSAELGHIPAPLLARLPAAREGLPLPAQGAIDRHFAQCAACREELALLVRLRTHTPRAATPESARGRRRTVPLWLGGYAVLATAAAVVFAVRGPLVTAPSDPAPGTTVAPEGAPGGGGAPDRPAAGAVPRPETSPAIGSGATPAWSIRLVPRTPRPLLPVVRGTGEQGTVVRRSGDSGALFVRVEALLPIADGDPVAIELLDRNERLLASTSAPWRDLHGGRALLLDTGATPLPAGSYVLRVRPGGAKQADPSLAVDHPFEVTAER